ncbi:ABC transporter permease subunit [Neisseriaceae bacterium B2N2-7]|uniref:ABC transporter permease subunit n=2 Tax=Craterilacuibacter sinensis TaxID=2686017 RepID=A0A845BS21_9NEIS|nr:ABC transporter permease subunit [Craterilacuibacter sinensis]
MRPSTLPACYCWLMSHWFISSPRACPMNPRTVIERTVVALSTLLAAAFAGLLLLILGFLLMGAWPALNGRLLFGDAPAWPALSGQVPVWDGLWPALAGSLMLVTLAIGIALPLSIAAGIHQAEYARGRRGRLAYTLVDLLAGMPSIVMGLTGFMLILLLRNILPEANTSLLLAACCVALLVLPYLVQATRVSLHQLPAELRLSAQALGLSQSQAILHVYLPAASPGILSGCILAIGRALEDVAVILLTGVVAETGLPGSLFDKFEALPFFIMVTAAEYRDEAQLARAFAAALLLMSLSALLFATARQLQKRSLS